MRIAITADFLDIENIGGAGRVIVEIARGLVESGHEVAIVAGGPREFSEPRTVLGVPVHWSSFHYDTRAQRGISFFLGTRRRVRRAWSALPFSPDRVVHNQPFTAYAIGAVSDHPHIVAVQLKILIPVGIAISIDPIAKKIELSSTTNQP